SSALDHQRESVYMGKQSECVSSTERDVTAFNACRMDVEVSVELSKGIYYAKCVSVGSTSPVGEKKDGLGANKNYKGLLEENIGCCYSEFGTQLDDVIGLPKRRSQCGMVEQATMSIGINHDDWIIIRVVISELKGVVRQEILSLVMLDDSYTNGVYLKS
ncbi:hypothetical protein L195_g044147, partial [Trifolium pratense]